MLEKMHELGRSDLKLIWITHAHYDHYGSAAALRELTGARIGIHPADAGDLAAGKSRLGTPRKYGFAYMAIQPAREHCLEAQTHTTGFHAGGGGIARTLRVECTHFFTRQGIHRAIPAWCLKTVPPSPAT